MTGTPCMIHLLGNGLGQNGSTLYTGADCARITGTPETVAQQARIPSATAQGEVILLCTKIPLSAVSDPKRRVPARSLGDASGEVKTGCPSVAECEVIQYF